MPIVIQINNLAGAPPPVVRDARARGRACLPPRLTSRSSRIDGRSRPCAIRQTAAVILIGDENRRPPPRRAHTVMGATIWTDGAHAGRPRVLPAGAKRCRRTRCRPSALVLACTLAHELGHVLMPDRAHCVGRVDARLVGREELQRADQGQLQFTPNEVARIRSSASSVSAFARCKAQRSAHSSGALDLH